MKRLPLFSSILVTLAATANTSRAATPLQFADGRSVDSGVGGNSAVAADLDGDGDLDVVSAIRNGPPYWYKNTDGLGNFSAGIDGFSTPDHGPRAVSAADLNGDGYIDVLVSFHNATSDLVM